MEEERQGTPVYRMLGVAGAGLVVALAVLLLVIYAPRLQRESPAERLQAALAQHFPGSEPEVALPGADAVRVALKVSFDPTVDAEPAQEAFRRTREVVKAQKLEGVKELEIELRGVSLDGGATSASRSFEVTAGSQESGARSQESGERRRLTRETTRLS